MIINHEELMRWAEGLAPHELMTDENALTYFQARKIRLEIAAEEIEDKPYSGWTRYVARVYLRDPHCRHRPEFTKRMSLCECGPLAERRL